MGGVSHLLPDYGRLLAYVILDGKNFNLELVRQGWSKYYTKYGKSEKYHSDFLIAENEAMHERLNIWSEPDEYQPPPKTTLVSLTYHGNMKSHTFHRSSCRHDDCKNCRKVFQSRQDAINAGDKPCGICKP
ncbi:thermonuclease family protein [uncultured Desulfobacter sp.]|uniref:thermonuclease family protein n=1 Tax=uncultured Desulfobacter sp. TaxID=240139 RepID=UPI0037487847